MSVIILTPDCYETIRKTLGCLRAQTVCDELEMTVVSSAAGGLEFHRHRFMKPPASVPLSE
jgi:hypothetical protein